jgi:hypothetical protein
MEEFTINVDQKFKQVIININEVSSDVVTYDDTYAALETMIKWARQLNTKEEIKDRCRLSSNMSWAKEYATIKFCLPRQSGHTTFIKKLIDRRDPGPAWGETGPNALFKKPVVIFPDLTIAHNTFAIDWNWVGVPSRLDKFLGIRPDSVIIDCASVYSQKQIDAIYRAFAYGKSIPGFLFLFLE